MEQNQNIAASAAQAILGNTNTSESVSSPKPTATPFRVFCHNREVDRIARAKNNTEFTNSQTKEKFHQIGLNLKSNGQAVCFVQLSKDLINKSIPELVSEAKDLTVLTLTHDKNTGKAFQNPVYKLVVSKPFNVDITEDTEVSF